MPFTLDLGTTHRATIVHARERFYIATGWKALKTWDGLQGPAGSLIAPSEAVQSAGLAGPSQVGGSWTPSPTTAAGVTTAGSHLVRYRYLSSSSGAVSNPSIIYTLAAAGSLKYTFPISTSGAANIIRSTQFRADKLVLEASEGGGTTFYKVTEVDMTATSVDFNLADATLRSKFLLWDDSQDAFAGQSYAGLGHSLPPVKRYIHWHRGRMWVYGAVIHRQGVAILTRDSQVLQGSGTGWSVDALGTAAAPPIGGYRFFALPGQEAGLYKIVDLTSETAGTILRVTNTVQPGWGNDSMNAAYTIVDPDRLIYVSRAGYPESFPPWSSLSLPGTGQITAGIGYGDGMLFFTAYRSFRFIWVVEPALDGRIQPIPGMRGALNQHVVWCQETEVYALDPQGFWMYRGGIPIDIGRGVWEMFRNEIDISKADNWHCAPVPDCKAIRWYVTTSAATYPDFYFQLDLVSGRWSTGRVDQRVSSSMMAPYQLATGQPFNLHLVLGDALGHTWYGDTLTMEGGFGPVGEATYRQLTASGGGTASTFQVAETLPSTVNGLKGSAITWVRALGAWETRLIFHHTDRVIVVDTPFSATPTAGDVLLLGRVQGKLTSKWFHGTSIKQSRRDRYVRIGYQPVTGLTSGARYVLVRIYTNQSSTAKTWGDVTWHGDPSNTVKFPGSVTGYALTDWLIDVTSTAGVAEIPVGDDAVTSFRFEIEVPASDTPLEIWSIEVEGVEAEAAI